MAQQKIIARGKVDFVPEDNRWLIRDIAIGTLELDWILRPLIGKDITISLEEEELEPAINERLKKVLVEA